MRIAHLTDLHVLERTAAERRGGDRLRLELLCNGRRIDPLDRRNRLLAALAAVRDARVDHLVITGDLTEDGSAAQFEALAEILADAGVDPTKTTLVAGNHDAYSGFEAWDDALRGPLAAFQETSRIGAPLDLGSFTVLPVCTRMEQPWIRAAGQVGADQREALAKALRDPSVASRPAIVAMHHPLVARSAQAFHWFDGLVDRVEVIGVLARHREAVVLHGHDHRRMDLPIGDEIRIRARGAFAVVDHPAPLRVYEVADGRIVPAAEARSNSSSHVAVHAAS